LCNGDFPIGQAFLTLDSQKLVDCLVAQVARALL